jgi:hypothetical protein
MPVGVARAESRAIVLVGHPVPAQRELEALRTKALSSNVNSTSRARAVKTLFGVGVGR